MRIQGQIGQMRWLDTCSHELLAFKRFLIEVRRPSVAGPVFPRRFGGPRQRGRDAANTCSCLRFRRNRRRKRAPRRLGDEAKTRLLSSVCLWRKSINAKRLSAGCVIRKAESAFAAHGWSAIGK